MADESLLMFKERPVTTSGRMLAKGDNAPEFEVVDQDWKTVQGLGGTRGRVRVLAAVPSLDTQVCDRETRRFNQEAAGLGPAVAVLVISADLPFAQKRWCGAAGIDQVGVLSDHFQMDFGRRYGCLINEIRLLRRAVFVVNRNDTIIYADYMKSLGDEPDYAAVLAAVRDSLD